MQPERLALLQGIIDNPEDDAPRLVYADWLEEYGDESDSARVQYIRLALEKARLPRSDPRRKELLHRMGVLLKEHRRRWFPDSPLIPNSPSKTRHRGFLRRVRGTAVQFNEHAEAVFAAEPVTDLYLEPGQTGFDQFAANPFLGRLRKIDFPEGSLPPGGLAQVAERLSSLRSLEISSWRANNAQLEVFVRASWPHLQRLLFHRCGLDDQALSLLSGLQARQMTSLQLASESFGARGLGSLLGAPWLAQLRQLDLTESIALPAEALQALVHRPQLANLRSLNLSHNPLGAEGLSVLAASPYLGQVRRLDLSYTQGGAPGLIALFNSPTLRQVSDLQFGSNELDFTTLSESKVTPWGSLRRLWIELSDHGLCWLLDRSLLNSVRHLSIFMAGLAGAGFLALLRSPLPRSLVSLDLSYNSLGSPNDLPSSLDFPRLRSLELNDCHLGNQGAIRLLRALRAPNLRELFLYKNDLGNEAVQTLTSNPTLLNLEELSLSYHPGIDDEGARLLCEAPYLDSLDKLQLFKTGISDSALAQLRRRFRRVYR